MKTYFSWKIFKIKIVSNKIIFNFNFDTFEANQFIDKEKTFIKKISNENYRYLKIIPDDLTKMFWGIDTEIDSKNFAKQVGKYFKKVNPKTEVLRFSEFLKNPKLNNLYIKVFNNVYRSFDKNDFSFLVDSKQFLEETKLRTTYYTKKPLPQKVSKELAKKAFALFAAQSAVLSQQKIYPNLILIAGERSKNTYKYDFYRYPKDKPILPKLFVI